MYVYVSGYCTTSHRLQCSIYIEGGEVMDGHIPQSVVFSVAHSRPPVLEEGHNIRHIN